MPAVLLLSLAGMLPALTLHQELRPSITAPGQLTRPAHYNTALVAPSVSLAVGKTYYVRPTAVPLLSQPASEAPVVAVQPQQSALQVLELTNAKWVRVRAGSGDSARVGYVLRSYLGAGKVKPYPTAPQ